MKLLPPLSPLTYYRRNLARSLPVGGAVTISVFLIAGIVTLFTSVDDSIQQNYGFLRHFSVLTGQVARDAPPALVAQVKREPHLKKIIDSVPYPNTLKFIIGELPMPVYGVEPGVMPELIALTQNRIVEGRLPEPGQPELVISRFWANNLGTKLGDKVTASDEKFPTITEPQKVVGILDGGANLALADIDYVVGALPDPNLVRPAHLLIPDAPENLHGLNTHIQDFIKNPRGHGLTRAQAHSAQIFTHEDMVRRVRKGLGYFFNFLAISDGLVIGAVALLSGFLANIYFESRLAEFGLLSAFGFRRERLAGRLVIETGALVVVSWLVGLLLTWLVLWLLDVLYMAPRGLILANVNALAVLYTLPTPIIVGLASLGTVLRRLYKLDPIEIMERR